MILSAFGPGFSRALLVLCVSAGPVLAQTGTVSSIQLEFEGPTVDLAMPSQGGRSLIQAHIGSGGPYSFLIDTGAGITVVDSGIARDLKLEVIGSLQVGVPGGGSVMADRVALPTIVVDGLRIEGAEAVVLDLAEMSRGLMVGVLGMDLFQDVLLTLDPRGQKATLTRGELSSGAPGVVQAEPVDGRMRFSVDVAGRPVYAQIDTGAPSGLTLGIDLIEVVPTIAGSERQASAMLVGGSRTIRVRTLDGDVSFGDVTYRNPRVGFMDPSPGLANIGSDILNELVTTFDQRNHRIEFQRAEEDQSAAHTPARGEGPRRLGVRFAGTPGGGFTTVASVEPGSLGEEVGFREGDALVSLNGKPIADYDQRALGDAIRGDGALEWVIKRDGKEMVILVP